MRYKIIYTNLKNQSLSKKYGGSNMNNVDPMVAVPIIDLDKFQNVLESFTQNMNDKYQDKWAFTGSAAIKYLSIIQGIDSKFVPNDLDFIILKTQKNELLYPSLIINDDYILKQTSPGRSFTYNHKDNTGNLIDGIFPKSFDILLSESINIIIVNNMPFISIPQLVSMYKVNIPCSDASAEYVDNYNEKKSILTQIEPLYEHLQINNLNFDKNAGRDDINDINDINDTSVSKKLKF